MTEVIPYCMNPLGARRPGSIGQAALGATLRLMDEHRKEVSCDEIGEVWVNSAAVMVGYWRNPEATTAALCEGWLRTGDLARRDEAGFYWFVGRKKEIIVWDGYNISPLEVEGVLYQHPIVQEAAVVGVPDATWGEQVQAFIALKQALLPEVFPEISSQENSSQASLLEAELLRFLRSQLADYKVPQQITILPELPKGLTGKIHRKTLKEQAIAHQLHFCETALPKTARLFA